MSVGFVSSSFSRCAVLYLVRNVPLVQLLVRDVPLVRDERIISDDVCSDNV